MEYKFPPHPTLTGTPLQEGIFACYGLGPLWRGVARPVSHRGQVTARPEHFFEMTGKPAQAVTWCGTRRTRNGRVARRG